MRLLQFKEIRMRGEKRRKEKKRNRKKAKAKKADNVLILVYITPL
jgi:hypothetical protein